MHGQSCTTTRNTTNLDEWQEPWLEYAEEWWCMGKHSREPNLKDDRVDTPGHMNKTTQGTT